MGLPDPDDPNNEEVKVRALDADDIALLKTYGLGPYAASIKAVEKARGCGAGERGEGGKPLRRAP